MKTVQVYIENSDEVIAAITEYKHGISGIAKDGYAIRVDGENLEIKKPESECGEASVLEKFEEVMNELTELVLQAIEATSEDRCGMEELTDLLSCYGALLDKHIKLL